MTYPTGQQGGQSFERFYLRHVAISEGCGCAELVIRRETQTPTVKDGASDRSEESLWRRLLARLQNVMNRPRRGARA